MCTACNRLSWLLLIVPVALISSWSACAQSPLINVGYFNELAMNGYDVKTYWSGGNSLEGNRDIRFKYKGATWEVSKENREAFAAEPDMGKQHRVEHCES